MLFIKSILHIVTDICGIWNNRIHVFRRLKKKNTKRKVNEKGNENISISKDTDVSQFWRCGLQPAYKIPWKWPVTSQVWIGPYLKKQEQSHYNKKSKNNNFWSLGQWKRLPCIKFQVTNYFDFVWIARFIFRSQWWKSNKKFKFRKGNQKEKNYWL